MGASRRFGFLIDTDQYARLRALARRRETSVAELTLGAVRDFCLKSPADREPLVKGMLGLKLPNIDWKKAKKEIETTHVGALGSAHE